MPENEMLWLYSHTALFSGGQKAKAPHEHTGSSQQGLSKLKEIRALRTPRRHLALMFFSGLQLGGGDFDISCCLCFVLVFESSPARDSPQLSLSPKPYKCLSFKA